jgi:hypothetical protein
MMGVLFQLWKVVEVKEGKKQERYKKEKTKKTSKKGKSEVGKYDDEAVEEMERCLPRSTSTSRACKGFTIAAKATRSQPPSPRTRPPSLRLLLLAPPPHPLPSIPAAGLLLPSLAPAPARW